MPEFGLISSGFGGNNVKEAGRVISVKGNSVIVEVQRKAACSSCGRCGGHISFSGDSLLVEAVRIGIQSRVTLWNWRFLTRIT